MFDIKLLIIRRMLLAKQYFTSYNNLAVRFIRCVGASSPAQVSGSANSLTLPSYFILALVLTYKPILHYVVPHVNRLFLIS